MGPSIGTLLKNKCISHDYVSSSLKPVLTKVAVRAVPACTEPTRLVWESECQLRRTPPLCSQETATDVDVKTLTQEALTRC